MDQSTVTGVSIENGVLSIRLSNDATLEFSAPHMTQFQFKRLNKLLGQTFDRDLVQRAIEDAENAVIDLSSGHTILELTAEEDIDPS